MMPRIRRVPGLLAAAGFTFLYTSLSSSPAFAQARGGAVTGGAAQTLSATAARQIQALLDEKAARTPTESKIATPLLNAMKQRRGQQTSAVTASLRSTLMVQKTMGRNGDVMVDIRGAIDKPLIEAINKIGGHVVYATPTANVLRARVPLDRLDALAGFADVQFIRPAVLARTLTQLRPGYDGGAAVAADAAAGAAAGATSTSRHRTDFAARAQRVRDQLQPLFDRRAQHQETPPPVTSVGAATSEGDVAHGAARARTFFGVNGSGVKIGVLSDSVDFLAQVQATGDLPPDVTVLPGQDGITPFSTGEGTAMLEIVHDLAPGAKLYFATAFTSEQSFADNIVALRAAGCDIIVDDVIYADEPPFQDGLVAQAVQAATNDGAMYFSSASNDGNFNDGTSSVWEGDFKSGGTLAVLPGGTVHDFGSGVISNRAESSSPFVLALFWSDPFGGSGNDYDLFILNNTLTMVLDASTDIQSGSGDPVEIIFPGAQGNERVVILKKTGAETRALHINNFGGQFGISTPGSTHGHNSVAKAFGVAAVDAAVAGGSEFTGGPTNPVELFSSDGLRRLFFTAEGVPYSPGNLLFGTGGGITRQKPDITAADGVVVTTPGFDPFFGTSAAAPHAAAIAGLVKAAKPSATNEAIRTALTSTALDIEAPGVDRDSGAGIIDAFDALVAIDATPRPFLELGPVTLTAVGGDGDAFVEPGENGRLQVVLRNTGGATAINVHATLATTTPGVTVTTANSNYPFIGSNGGTATNITPFAFTLSPTAPCGLLVHFTLTVSYSLSPLSPQTLEFDVQTGQPSPTLTTLSYTGPARPIPDASEAGVNVPLTVSGIAGGVAAVKFSIDGATCTSTEGATTVGLNHTWVGDLVLTLRSPAGTTVTLMERPGGIFNDGNNFCQTGLDDSAVNPIQAISPAGSPWTGTFKPASPLAAFNGENPNGTWTLNAADLALGDTGSVRAFSLKLNTFVCDASPTVTTTQQQ
jgi:subtilisin-like proprotein convertase family protein